MTLGRSGKLKSDFRLCVVESFEQENTTTSKERNCQRRMCFIFLKKIIVSFLAGITIHRLTMLKEE